MADEENQVNNSDNTEEPTDDDLQQEGDVADSDVSDDTDESAGDTQQQGEVSGGAPQLAIFSDERIDDLPIETEMRDSYLTYAMSTIVSRALPDVRDGLKPSQRRVLVAMNDLNLGPRSKHRKCAKIVGDTSGNYHPHGDQSSYATLVRMGQHWSMRYPLIQPQGNFGSVDGDPPAAMRYTEARMRQSATELLHDINLDTVDMQPNYDDTRTEPVVLPAKFPNLLVNGSQGIAVGMATSIPPHNITEICDALLHLTDNPEATVDDIMKIVTGPDFPTGGLICGRKGIVDGYKTGRGKLRVRAKMHTEQVRGGKEIIVVTEIPYQVLKTTIIERIADTVKNGKIPDIADVQDHSDRTGMRIVIDLKKNTEAEVVVNQLYKYTPLQSTFSVINIALVNGAPRTLNIREMLWYFLEHRKDVIRRRTMFLLRRARQRAHILEGLILAVADIDRIIELIKTSPDVPTAKQRLMELKLNLTEEATIRKILPETFVARASQPQKFTNVQAEQILGMQLRRLTGLEIEKLAADYSALCEEIEGYEAILDDEVLLLDVIREDIYEMKDRYGDARRTELVADAGEFNIEDLIAEEDVVVTLTHEGYIKRMPTTTYRRQGRGGQGVIGNDAKEGDFIEQLFVASTHDYMLVFLDSGRMHWLKVYDIPSMARTSKGRAIVNLLQMDKEERIRAVVAVRDFDDRFLVTTTRNGQIKKTALTAYANVRKGGILATGIREDDCLIGVAITTGDDEIVLGTCNGQAIRFNETNARAMGRTATGVRGINLKGDDKVVDMIIVDQHATLLTVCENGFGKRTNFEEYRIQSRGGSGIINIRATDRNGKVVGMKSVRDSDEMMMITQNGKVVRTGINEMRVIGRATQGVRVITLKPGDKLVSIAKVVSEDNSQQELPLEPPDAQQPLPLTGTTDDAKAPETEPTEETTE
ncbi:MAG: DNA gyrase subunit A [Phycisphaerae bacterium]|nr:DNA gyrase subunit A [Phycisphaerae bacterium]